MSNVLIGIIGVILFIGLALAGALFLGERFTNSRNQSEAARFVSEGSQISKAYEMFRINEGAYPTGVDPSGADYDPVPDQARLVELKSKGYLKSIPKGVISGTNAANGAWYVDASAGAAYSLIGSTDSAKSICKEARKQIGLSGEPLACSDSALTNSDPCCTG
jgi:hypothetical protein